MKTALLRWLKRELARRAASNRNVQRWLAGLTVAPLLAVLLTVLFIALLVGMEIASQQGGGCGTTVPVGAPGQNVRTAVQVVQYFESQGISANGAAGIEGNLEQESTLNPEEVGGGLAQWLGGRWSDMVAKSTGWGYPGDSATPAVAMAGQLMYIVYDLRTSYVNVLQVLNSATSTATAVLAFESGYEECSGTNGFMVPVPKGSACNPSARQSYASTALQASGGSGIAVPASFVTGGTCVAVGGAGGDPIPGFSPSRDDMGVDACGKPGMPILAPAQSTLIEIVPGWYGPQPLMLFQFNPPLAGAYQNDQYWYVAEQIVPLSTAPGTVFGPGQPVATYASSGTCIEIGWGSPTTNSRTLVPTDVNPPPRALTPEAEAFKAFFHIPWVGQSP